MTDGLPLGWEWLPGLPDGFMPFPATTFGRWARSKDRGDVALYAPGANVGSAGQGPWFSLVEALDHKWILAIG